MINVKEQLSQVMQMFGESFRDIELVIMEDANGVFKKIHPFIALSELDIDIDELTQLSCSHFPVNETIEIYTLNTIYYLTNEGWIGTEDEDIHEILESHEDEEFFRHPDIYQPD